MSRQHLASTPHEQSHQAHCTHYASNQIPSAAGSTDDSIRRSPPATPLLLPPSSQADSQGKAKEEEVMQEGHRSGVVEPRGKEKPQRRNFFLATIEMKKGREEIEELERLERSRHIDYILRQRTLDAIRNDSCCCCCC